MVSVAFAFQTDFDVARGSPRWSDGGEASTVRGGQHRWAQSFVHRDDRGIDESEAVVGLDQLKASLVVVCNAIDDIEKGARDEA